MFCSFSSEISNIGYTVLRVSWAVRVLAATALTKVFSEHKAITSQSLQIAVGYQTEKRFILFPNLIQKHSQNSSHLEAHPAPLAAKGHGGLKRGFAGHVTTE